MSAIDLALTVEAEGRAWAVLSETKSLHLNVASVGSENQPKNTQKSQNNFQNKTTLLIFKIHELFLKQFSTRFCFDIYSKS